jgi:hypothetical protein
VPEYHSSALLRWAVCGGFTPASFLDQVFQPTQSAFFRLEAKKGIPNLHQGATS